jgi:hypothetical protein
MKKQCVDILQAAPFTFNPEHNLSEKPGQLSGIALGYGIDDRGFESRQGLGTFLFTTTSRQALGPTQPPSQWITGALYLGVKRQGREPYH